MTIEYLRLPSPRIEEWEWQMSAACRDADTDLFFESTPGTYEEQAARNLCAACPVLEQCREYALDANEPHGVWGGLTATERDVYRRQRKWFVAPLAS